jgi:hypothetical protein
MSSVSGFFLYIQNLQTTHVGSTARTDSMGQDLVVALRATHQSRRANGVVGAAAIAATFTDLSFR